MKDNSPGGHSPHHCRFRIIIFIQDAGVISSIIIIISSSFIIYSTTTTATVSQAKPRSRFRRSSNQNTATKDSPRGSSGAKGRGESCSYSEDDKERAEEEGH